MKLIFCRACQDIVRLIEGDWRRCDCGRSAGTYVDPLKAQISGPCIPLGIDNRSLALALAARPASGLGERFEAFVIPEECSTVEVVDG